MNIDEEETQISGGRHHGLRELSGQIGRVIELDGSRNKEEDDAKCHRRRATCGNVEVTVCGAHDRFTREMPPKVTFIVFDLDLS